LSTVLDRLSSYLVYNIQKTSGYRRTEAFLDNFIFAFLIHFKKKTAKIAFFLNRHHFENWCQINRVHGKGVLPAKMHAYFEQFRGASIFFYFLLKNYFDNKLEKIVLTYHDNFIR
jgi:hypothetical protein